MTVGMGSSRWRSARCAALDEHFRLDSKKFRDQFARRVPCRYMAVPSRLEPLSPSKSKQGCPGERLNHRAIKRFQRCARPSGVPSASNEPLEVSFTYRQLRTFPV
jgi:hypothetical protein